MTRARSRLLDEIAQDPEFREPLAQVRAARETAATLRALRKDAGLTQQALASRLGVSQARISQVESGLLDHLPPLDFVYLVAEACGTSVTLARGDAHAMVARPVAMAAEPRPAVPMAAVAVAEANDFGARERDRADPVAERAAVRAIPVRAAAYDFDRQEVAFAAHAHAGAFSRAIDELTQQATREVASEARPEDLSGVLDDMIARLDEKIAEIAALAEDEQATQTPQTR